MAFGSPDLLPDREQSSRNANDLQAFFTAAMSRPVAALLKMLCFPRLQLKLTHQQVLLIHRMLNERP
jgi:hypothetical protein